MYKNRTIFFFLFLFNLVVAQYSQIPGTPFIKNYSEGETNCNLTIYDTSQGDTGELYFATPEGLLEFDGVRWEKYSSGRESDLRAVLYKDKKHIYTSGHGVFGYWSKNEEGKLEYTSLFIKLPTKQSPLLPVFWKIAESQGKILFQTFQQIFIYDPLTGDLDVIVAKKGYNLMFSSKNRIFIQDTGLGLFEIKGKEQILIEGTDKVDLNIIGVVAKNFNELLIITKNDGIWLWKDNEIKKLNIEINNEIERYLVDDINEFESDKIILGTRRNGVYIISYEGKVLLHIDKSHGILNNTINTVFADLNNNVWLGLQNGISYLQVSGSNTYLIDTKGAFGTVYTSYLDGKLLYLGTNQGLFYKDISNPYSDPKIIDKDLEQIWEIQKIDNQIFVGSHKGVFEINNKKAETVHIEGGAWKFKKHPKIDDILYIGFYSGISVFKQKNGKWKFEKKLEGYGESSRFIEFDQLGQIWVAHPSKGYYRLRLSDDGMNLKEVEFYGVNNSNVETYAYLCKIDDNLVFYNPKGFFNYDPIDNSFINAKYPSEIFKEEKGLNSISQKGNIFWYSSPNSMGYILRDGNQFKNVREPFYSVRKNHLLDFNKFKLLKDSLYGIGISNGMLFHKVSNKDIQKKKASPIIRYIQLISTKDTIQASIIQNDKLEVPYRNNFIKIGFALPKTPLGSSKQIQYKLNGLNNDWSNWEYASELNFPGLTSGNYKLEIKVRGDNEDNPEILSKEFYVNYPWYISKIAFAVYFIIFVLVNVLYSYYFKRRNRKNIELVKLKEEEKRQRQNDIHELEKLETEKEMLILKEENLKLEIKKKNSALASSTLNNIKKNELLTDLILDIGQIDKDILNSSLHSPIKKVIKKINSHLVDKEDWLTFELHFRNSHFQFFNKLREKHPDLSSGEIKISAYLKLNLSSKEIASLMNISVRSVEQSRYRLRKKLDLAQDSSLVNYIQSF